jgi:hypothetical protein
LRRGCTQSRSSAPASAAAQVLLDAFAQFTGAVRES